MHIPASPIGGCLYRQPLTLYSYRVQCIGKVCAAGGGMLARLFFKEEARTAIRRDQRQYT